MPPIAIDDETLTSSFNWISALSDSVAGDMNFAAPGPGLDTLMAEAVITDVSMVEAGSGLSLPKVEESSMADIAPLNDIKVEESGDQLDQFFNDLEYDDNVDLTVMNLEFDGLGIDCVGQQPIDPLQEVNIPGLRFVPCPTLHAASKGEEKSKSVQNDKWSLRRADQLRSALGYNMSMPFGDLPFSDIDEILSNLFSQVVKLNGEDYPSASLNNMLGGFNRLIRRASEMRSLRGDKSNEVGRGFCIKKHPAFTRTRITIRAAIQKTARDGNNKKTKKVEVLTQCMEDAILADVDHQITSSTGVQKRLALYLMTHCGIRGGDELWCLMRSDLSVLKDSRGREYVMFKERRSKNNEYNENRTNENQFRKTYHSFEPDFVLTAKQYLRHLPELVDGMKPDLFLQPIPNPASIVWNNRVHKMALDRCTGILKDMLKIVNLLATLIHNYTNKSGRATLVMRMAARGVPDDTGRLVTGHHTISGYANYDRTAELKQEAAVLCSSTPGLTFDVALKEVSANFVQEKVIGNFDNLNPLMDAGTAQRMEELKRIRESEHDEAGKQVVSQKPRYGTTGECSSSTSLPQYGSVGESSSASLALRGTPQAMAAWHQDYDGINWEEEFKRNPSLARVLGGTSQVSNVANHMAGIYSNCHITIHVVQPGQTQGNSEGRGKENQP